MSLKDSRWLKSTTMATDSHRQKLQLRISPKNTSFFSENK
jgi:hypothetical protein